MRNIIKRQEIKYDLLLLDRGGLNTIITCVLKHRAQVLKRYVVSEIVYYNNHNA